jgi:myo-inositol-hexaphosphate 3-phosphohydrolase
MRFYLVELKSPPTAISTPRVNSHTSPDEPTWIINGKNKMPKLRQLLGTTENVCVIVYDLEDKQVAEIRDMLDQQTDLNKLVGTGQNRLKFLDENGNPIRLTQEVANVLRLK